MSNAMTHEPISYLDSILNEEEKRCEYGHQWRNFTISRSGRFKSKNKKRDIVDGKLFDSNATATAVPTPSKDECGRYKEQDKFLSSCQSSTSTKSYQQKSTAKASSSTKIRDKPETYKSYYETNL